MLFTIIKNEGIRIELRVIEIKNVVQAKWEFKITVINLKIVESEMVL